MNQSLHDKIAVSLLKEPVDAAYTDCYSQIFDTQGFEALEILVIVGALTGADGSNYLLPVLEECDTTVTGSFTTVATTEVQGAFTKIDAAAEDSLIQRVGYSGTKRYVRVLFNYTGTGISAGIVGAVGIAANARISPPSDVTPVAAT